MMAMMTDQNANSHFQSKLRAIFLSWREHTKKQKHFSTCIQNVITKAVWQKGFQNIREYSRDKTRTRGQNKSLDKIKRMFFRRNCKQAFNKWR